MAITEDKIELEREAQSAYDHLDKTLETWNGDYPEDLEKAVQRVVDAEDACLAMGIQLDRHKK